MSSAINKMQLRADIMSILNFYSSHNKKINHKRFEKDIEILEDIDDKDFLAQILFKELLSDNKDYVDICANIALIVIPIETFKKVGIKFLENGEIPDNKKFYFISLLEHKGISIDYENLELYITNPVEISNEGIQEFLEDAIVNPEARIDLLDFYNNISKEERIYLLNSLLSEYKGDIMCNALNILSNAELDKDEIEILVKVLLKTDSYYSFRAANNILKNYKLTNSLQLKLRTYVKNKKEKYQGLSDKPFLCDSSPYVCFMSFVDGASNFSLVFTRKYFNKTLSTFFLTINLNVGVTSCIGFYNIEENYFNKMLRRLFTDSLPVKINHFEFKEILEYFVLKNNSTNNALPYEFNIWNELTGDIKYKGVDIYKYLADKLPETSLNKVKFEKISKSKLIENWYFEKGECKIVDDIICELNENRITDINKINDVVTKNIDRCFESNDDIINEIKQRLILQGYVSLLGGFNASSSVLFEVSKNQKYLKEIFIFFIYKSLYIYFNDIVSKNSKNIFNKKDKTTFTKKESKEIIKQIELKFIGNESDGN